MPSWFDKVKAAIDRNIFSEEHDPYYDSSETDSISSVQETAIRKVREPKESLPQSGKGREAGGNNVIPLNPRKNMHEIMVSFASDRKEMFQCADALKSGKSVLVVLTQMKSHTVEMQSIIDFLTGVAYNLDGKRKKIVEGIFLYTPGNVNITMPVGYDDSEGAASAIGGAAGVDSEDKKIVPFIQKSLPASSASSQPPVQLRQHQNPQRSAVPPAQRGSAPLNRKK